MLQHAMVVVVCSHPRIPADDLTSQPASLRCRQAISRFAESAFDLLPSSNNNHQNHHSKISRAAMPVQLGATLAEIEEAFAHEGGVQIAQTDLVGEETLTRFDSKIWFAVQVGDVLEDRYQVLGKVANGGSSTIWFVRDAQ